MYKLVSELCNDKPHYIMEDGQEVVLFPWLNKKDNKTISVDYHLLADIRSNVCPLVDGLNPYVKDNRIDIDDYSSIGNLGRVLYEIHGNVMFICGVFVHPRMRGKGWMKHLISMAYKDVSAEEAIDYIVLNPKKHPSSPLDNDSLREAYERIDFVSVGLWCSMLGLPKPSDKVVWSKYSNLLQKKARTEGNHTMIVPCVDRIPRVRMEEAWTEVMSIMPTLLSEWSVW